MSNTDPVLIGVVGPCAAGKTTLIAALKEHGYHVRHIAQEHSYVKDMWRRITNPDLLIFLDVSFEISMQRRRMNWNESDYQEQIRRLEHAHNNADLLINTDLFSPQEVLQQTLNFILSRVGQSGTSAV